jgi:hypothetical protein
MMVVAAYTSGQCWSPDVMKACTRRCIQLEHDAEPLQYISRSAQHRVHGWGILAEQWVVWMISERSNKKGAMKMNENYNRSSTSCSHARMCHIQEETGGMATGLESSGTIRAKALIFSSRPTIST